MGLNSQFAGIFIGATIHDVAEDLIIDVSGSTVVLVHFTGNWIIKGVPL